MSEMSKFGAIPTAAICRFGELTKTEIIVLCYLYSRRNRHTGQCNPSQKDIAIATKTDKAHVCRAMVGLYQKGWAIPDNVTGQIDLEIPLIVGKPSLPFHRPKVAKSATSELPNPQPAVAESATQVAKSATESCEIRNHIYKDLTHKGTHNEQIIEHTPSNADKSAWVDEIFAEWQTVLNHPNAILDTKRRNRIKARIKDGFSLEELKSVPHGVLRSPFHLGDNADGKRHDGISTIYRDTEQVEKFRDLATQPIKDNGTNRTSHRQQRANEAISEYEFESQLRERVRQRKAELPGSPVLDNCRQLPPFKPVPNG